MKTFKWNNIQKKKRDVGMHFSYQLADLEIMSFTEMKVNYLPCRLSLRHRDNFDSMMAKILTRVKSFK